MGEIKERKNMTPRTVEEGMGLSLMAANSSARADGEIFGNFESTKRQIAVATCGLMVVSANIDLHLKQRPWVDRCGRR